jgi:HlyD family secretion protein
MKKKIVFSALIVAGLAIVGYGVLARTSSQKYEFRYDKVSLGDINAYVTASGTINPVTSVDVGTQVSGIVAKLYADFNSVIKKGQLIAQIDSTFLIQTVKDDEASLDKAKAQYADSKRNLDREKSLLDKGLDSQLNYDAALTTEASNAAALKSAEATLDGARINLAYANIRAPISGVVINRAINIGQTVAASFSSPTLYTIANDLSKMQVLATVDESDIGRISIGQVASFTVDAYPDETFKGTISQIRLAPVSIQNVVNYTVVIDVNNDQLKLMPGMTATVKVLVAGVTGVLRISNMALRFQPPADVIDSSKVISRKDPLAMTHTGEEAGTSTGNRAAVAPASVGAAIAPTLNPVKSNGFEQFGISLRFPEYEKSAYVPQHQAGRARVWVMNAKGKVEPVFVRTGTTDGKYTEITSPDLKVGDQIVLGATSKSESADAASSPLTAANQQRPAGGGFR